MSEPERERFEAWIAGLPYERDTARHSDNDEQIAWPGQYVDLAVQLAWEAWQEACCADLAALLAEARGEEREACATLLETEAARLTGGDPALSSAWDDLLAEELRELAGRVRAREAAASRWIPTAEALPAEGEEVLVWLSSGRVTSAVCRDNEHGFWTQYLIGPREDVRTWQPLPEGPPEEGEGEQP